MHADAIDGDGQFFSTDGRDAIGLDHFENPLRHYHRVVNDGSWELARQ